MKDEWLAVVKEGVVTGLIGYAAVAIVMAIINVVGGHSAFYTPAVLGATLFYGITDPAQVQVLPAYVFAFNGLHLMAFLFFGVAGAWFAWLSDKGEQLWYPGIFFFVFVAFHLVGAAQMLATPARVALPDGEAWGSPVPTHRRPGKPQTLGYRPIGQPLGLQPEYLSNLTHGQPLRRHRASLLSGDARCPSDGFRYRLSSVANSSPGVGHFPWNGRATSLGIPGPLRLEWVGHFVWNQGATSVGIRNPQRAA